jgi:hypothetical protein
MRLLAVVFVVVAAVGGLAAGGCGSGSACVGEGGHCDSGSSFDCCGSLVCVLTGPSTYTCVHEALTAVPAGR